MKKVVTLLFAILLVGFGLYQLASDEEPSEGREPIGKPLPIDKTVERKVVDEKINEVVISKLTKKQEAQEDLPDRELPAPRPREPKASAETESAWVLDAMALDSWKRGDIAGAMELFEEALKADPDDARAHSDYGYLLTLMAAYRKAYAHYERAAELEPDDPAVWLDLKTLYERDKKLERASEAGRRAEELAGGQEIVQDEHGFYRLKGYSAIP